MAPSLHIIKQRFQGALVGALIGDCYGAPFEGCRQNDPIKLVSAINKLSEREGILKYTDDTAMSITTCSSLIQNNGLDPRHLAKEFSESYFKEPRRGYGQAVCTVFRELKKNNFQDPFEPASMQFDGRGSFGNGAAMRCIGIGLFAFAKKLSDKEILDLSENCARITHTHVHGINGATLLVIAVKYVIQLDKQDLNETDFLNHLIQTITDIEDEQDRVYSQKLKIIMKVLDNLNVSGNDTNQQEIVELIGNDVAAQNSVPLAIYSFLRGISKFDDSYHIDNEFFRTLHWAISCGGDTDTIASMACGLCGAYIGLNEIPEKLFKNCEAWQHILGLADQLYSEYDKT